VTAGHAAAPPSYLGWHDDTAWPPWRGLSLTPSYVAFLLFCAIVITYAFGGAGMVGAAGLAGLIFERRGLTIPAFVVSFALLCIVGLIGVQTTQWPTLVKLEIGVYFRFLAILVVAVNVLTSKSRFRFFVFFLLACYAFFPVRGGFFNYFGGNTIYGRTYWTGVFGNPNDLFALLFFPLGLCGYILVTEKHRLARLLAGTGIVLIAGDMLITQSRGGILGLGLALAVWFFSRRHRARDYVVVGAAAIGLAIWAPDAVWTRMSNLFSAAESGQLMSADDQGSADQRLELWKVGVQIYQENPVIGVGLGAYPATHREYARRVDFRRTALGARDAHSTYLSVAAEAGTFGLVFFLGTVGFAVTSAERARRRLKAVDKRRAEGIFMMELGLLGFMVAAVFGSYSNVGLMYLQVLTLWAAGRVYDPRLSGSARPTRSR
jgi:O-antigen ligase